LPRAPGRKKKGFSLFPGGSHIRTYWVPEYVDQAVAQLQMFYAKNL